VPISPTKRQKVDMLKMNSTIAVVAPAGGKLS
jgi:hypothetical protein